MDFNTAKKWFKKDRIRDLAESSEGLRFLKLRSLARRKYLDCLFSAAAIDPTSSRVGDLFREAFETAALDDLTIDKTIKAIYEAEREQRRNCEDELVNQLYRLEVFDWGGLHQSNLEKAIVDNYIKKIRDYDQLSCSIENEIHNSMRGYVLCSWFNHWTSIIIEDIFRDHPSVLPAVGSIKKIDFFIKGVPFDLKVTYLPEGYIKHCRKTAKKKPELTLLKKWARRHNVAFSKCLSDNRILPDLWNKASDHPSAESLELLSELSDFRKQLINAAKSNPETLIQWLYENQGERRFDASNRLFLVLIDCSNFFLSWKLKRAKPLLDSEISSYLDGISSFPGRTLDFNWEGTNYTVVSDAIVITKP